jgi:hypothetical protein
VKIVILEGRELMDFKFCFRNGDIYNNSQINIFCICYKQCASQLCNINSIAGLSLHTSLSDVAFTFVFSLCS